MSGALAGRLCVITGGTFGIGRAVALLLAGEGASLVLVGRDAAHADEAVAAVRHAGSPDAEALLGDLSSQEEVCRLASEIRQRHARVHSLVNNAGGLFLRRRVSVDGVGMTWALNHLAPFLLTNLLVDVLTASAPARIVNVASEAHAQGHIDFDNPGALDGPAAYYQSKLASVLFTRALARRLDGTGVTANAVHPGRVASGFGVNNGWAWQVLRPFVHRGAMTPEAAAPAVARLLIDPRLSATSGRYFDREREATPAPQALDDAASERLWAISERMTAVSTAG
jgi:NAD(P)-dependent dehydrogenase (short-subunit alcohol dehydrogenase family)